MRPEPQSWDHPQCSEGSNLKSVLSIDLEPVSIQRPTVAVGAPEFSVATLMPLSKTLTSVGGTFKRCSFKLAVPAARWPTTWKRLKSFLKCLTSKWNNYVYILNQSYREHVIKNYSLPTNSTERGIRYWSTPWRRALWVHVHSCLWTGTLDVSVASKFD